MTVRVVTCVEVSSFGDTPTCHYFPNRAPLQPVPFQKLPPGSIKPDGWLLGQLRSQINGLNGKLSEISDYLVYDQCGWVDPTKSAWEELPYWLRGFTDLAFVTGDQTTLALANRWIDGILSSQQVDGWFGPNDLRTSLEGGPDLWPAMPLLNVFRSFYEYTNDARVIPFLVKYFQFINQQSAAVFSRGWSYTRWADNIDTIIWLYNRTTDTDWLLDLIHKIHSNSADWLSGLPTWHNVNIAQGFREPALYSLVVNPPDSRFLLATYDDYQKVMNQYGQFPGGGFAGDENCRTGYGDPRQGIETCGIVEFMNSFEILTRITGDGLWADRCETLAFNTLPAAFDPIVGRGTHYITCANCIQLDDQTKTQQQFQNNFPMLAYKPGVHQYRCCTHNHGMGWPYYAEAAWLATYDGGLCASLYVSNQVTALVGPNDGTQVTIIEETDYPFDGTVKFRFQLSTPTQFKLYLRVPCWCRKAPTLSLNGQILFNEKTSNNGSYLIVDRLWVDDDALTFTIPLSLRIQTWTSNHSAVSLSYGPLTFSLGISEQYNRIGGTDDWPEFEVIPKSNWNYGLVMASSNEWLIKRKKIKNGFQNLFTKDTVPLNLEVRARRIPEWQADSQNVVGLLPQSPVHSQESDEILTLIPMGAARLRITTFPTIAQ
ncbi:unnamed protein product [Rotaria socialis]|uniref:Transcriptional initiation protein Tat n=2 Tax=Rotaria socialis TaxID=392032 RepID=A0A817V3E1_9BILA|nr:unnamed protein product [Rotaria socialis]CAF3426961.1 unnamed protein product [Rotaria socialis]CAF3446794.1 unnamed protein product [Rotaria socialis]CAF3524825.1 unnamed protein product [Rotaria socialis]CAF4246116.1 unnamed protein product [Rotaria socialis]